LGENVEHFVTKGNSSFSAAHLVAGGTTDAERLHTSSKGGEVNFRVVTCDVWYLAMKIVISDIPSLCSVSSLFNSCVKRPQNIRCTAPASCTHRPWIQNELSIHCCCDGTESWWTL